MDACHIRHCNTEGMRNSAVEILSRRSLFLRLAFRASGVLLMKRVNHYQKPIVSTGWRIKARNHAVWQPYEPIVVAATKALD